MNDAAIPNQGELYAIVRTKSIRNRSSYHIAYVIYSDDRINITIEAEADNETQYQPKFCLYDKNPLGNTFHKRWTGELYKRSDRVNYLYKNGVTVVLTMRPDIRTTNAVFDNGIIPTGVRRPVAVAMPIFVQNTSSSRTRGTTRKRSSSRNSRESSKSAKRTRSNES
jgi:hypothetical protein